MATEANLPIDTSVSLPPSVQRQIQAADAIHKAVYTPDAAAQPVSPQPDNLTPENSPQAVTAPVTPAAPARDPDYEHQYNSMRGRFAQSQRMVGELQEQLAQTAEELQRATAALEARQGGSAPVAPGNTPAHQRITEADLQTYGSDLIDVIRRAAYDVVAPELQSVKSGVKKVAQRVQQSAALSVSQVLDRDVPNWNQINHSPEFNQWCSLPDIYSGVLRSKLLNQAYQAADAPRVVAFFQGFLSETGWGQAAGQAPIPAQGQPVTPVNEPQVRLEALIAPGKGRPAPGLSQVPAEKPTFTMQQVRWFYSQDGYKYYRGRDAERKADEQELFAAQREGRIKG